MSAPTFNKFKSTTIYGQFNNLDYPDNTVLASAYFQRNLSILGDLSSSGIIYGNKLYYDNVDISSTFVSNTALNTKLSTYALSSALSNYALLSGATFFGAVNGVTPLTNDVSSKLATTSFVNNVLSATLTGYANLSGGATFSGALRATTQGNADNSSLVATTGFVKNQAYLTSASLSTYATTASLSSYATTASLSSYATTASLSNYATTPSLSSYALLSGATFSGALRAITQGNTDNSSNVATTAYVKNQAYLTSASLSPYALTTSLSSYALTSALSSYALTSSLSSYALTSALSSYALLSGASFENTVNVKNTLNLIQSSSTSSTILQFNNDIGQARALIYSSAISNVFRFSVMPAFNANGFEWEKQGNTLMTLDLSGNLTIAGNMTTSTPIYSTITVPTTNTIDDFQGNYYTTYTRRPTNSVNQLNGVTTVNIGLPLIGTAPNFYPIAISQVYYALGTLANPDTPNNCSYCVLSPSYGATPTNITNFINISMYNVNGTRVRGYGTLLKSYSTNSYSIIFVATDGVGFAINTSYVYDPFQFSYV